MSKKSAPRPKSKSAINKVEERGRHFANISIKNFRCFKDFSIESLERINLIGGKNNVGKTTLLEALFLLLGATNVHLILLINIFRGIDIFRNKEILKGDATSIQEMLWSHLFYNFDDQAIITINGGLGLDSRQITLTFKQTDKVSTTILFDKTHQEKLIDGNIGISPQALKIQYSDVSGKPYPIELVVDAQGIHLPQPVVEPIFPGIFLSARHRPTLQENANRFGQLDITKKHDALLSALKIIEPRLKRLSTIVVGNLPMLYGDIGLSRMLPLATMGDGLGSLASLLLAIFSSAGGVVLIDEFENGFHYSSLVKVWKAIAEATRLNDTQVFATTHSWECIKAAHEAFRASEQYDFRFHRLQQVNDTFEAVTFDQDTLQTSIESGWEIR